MNMKKIRVIMIPRSKELGFANPLTVLGKTTTVTLITKPPSFSKRAKRRKMLVVSQPKKMIKTSILGQARSHPHTITRTAILPNN